MKVYIVYMDYGLEGREVKHVCATKELAKKRFYFLLEQEIGRTVCVKERYTERYERGDLSEEDYKIKIHNEDELLNYYKESSFDKPNVDREWSPTWEEYEVEEAK